MVSSGEHDNAERKVFFCLVDRSRCTGSNLQSQAVATTGSVSGFSHCPQNEGTVSVRHSESEVRGGPAFTCHSLDERLALPPAAWLKVPMVSSSLSLLFVTLLLPSLLFLSITEHNSFLILLPKQHKHKPVAYKRILLMICGL